MTISKWLSKLLGTEKGHQEDSFSSAKQPSQEPAELPTIFIIKEVPRIFADLECTSFFGRRPLVPKSFVWPERAPTAYEKTKGRVKNIPLHFICQFDCSKLPEIESPALPKSGLILVFCALDLEDFCVEEEPPFWKVIHCETNSELSRADPPKGLKNVEIGDDLQTGERGQRGRYKELGYMPISFKFGMTSPDLSGSSRNYKQEQEYKETRRRAKLHYLGPEPPSPNMDITELNLSVRTARTWLKQELYIVPARIEVMTGQLADFYAGKRQNHSGKGFFAELKSAKKKVGKAITSDEEIWQELAEEWQALLVRFKAQLPKLILLKDALDKMSENDFLPNDVRAMFQDQMNFSNDVSILKNTLDSDDSKRMRQYILSRSCLEAVKLSELEIALAEFERKVIDGNENHLLGYSDEVQAFSRRDAFAYSTTMHWMKPNQSEEDLTLFLQLDSCFAGTGMMWGDAGKLYFYIPREDLASQRFDRIALAIQTH